MSHSSCAISNDPKDYALFDGVMISNIGGGPKDLLLKAKGTSLCLFQIGAPAGSELAGCLPSSISPIACVDLNGRRQCSLGKMPDEALTKCNNMQFDAPNLN